MVCWVATYPGCGSTLVSQIVKKVFGTKVHFTTEDRHSLFSAAELDVMGYTYLERPWDEFYKHAQECENVIFIKSHDPPIDDHKAIVVVRDGRAAAASYWHYQNFYFPNEKTSLLDVIVGNTPYNDWSYFYNHWNPLARPQTLFLRFEELKTNAPPLITKMTDFVRLEAQSSWVDDFAQSAKTSPGIFRSGTLDSWKKDFDEDLHKIFWYCHQGTMTKLGYAPTPEDTALLEQPLYQSNALFSELLHKFRSVRENLEQKQQEIAMLHRVCQERLDLINHLNSLTQ